MLLLTIIVVMVMLCGKDIERLHVMGYIDNISLAVDTILVCFTHYSGVLVLIVWSCGP